MQNASWLRLKQTSPQQLVARVHDRDAGHALVLDELQGGRDRVAGRHARRVGVHVRPIGPSPSAGQVGGVSVPRKRSPSVTSSSFLRGLKNARGRRRAAWRGRRSRPRASSRR